MIFRQLYKRNCHSSIFRPFVRFGKSLNRFYENRNYDHETNGEQRVLQVLSKFDCEVIIDVGANVGAWTIVAQRELPNARFFCFEPVSETYSILKKIETSSICTYNLALGPRCEKTRLNYYPKGHALSSIYRFELHSEEPQEAAVEMITGDEFMRKNGIEAIDFLKIDTEGFDLQVLKGFENHLRTGSVKVIQFEYGLINIVSRSLLYDFYSYLGSCGYRIGKIYPKSVDFAEYNYEMEDFVGPNFIAVRSDNKNLIGQLISL